MSQYALSEHIGVLIANKVHEANLVVDYQEYSLIFVKTMVFEAYG